MKYILHSVIKKAFSPILLLLLFTLNLECSVIDAEFISKYESYALTFGLFIIMVIFLLFYLTFRYKKMLNRQHKLLLEKEIEVEEFKTLNHKKELQKVEENYNTEKKFLELKNIITNLEEKEKEGLKSQVVTKIEEYENRRLKLLERSNIQQ
jgi:amino acid permease